MDKVKKETEEELCARHRHQIVGMVEAIEDLDVLSYLNMFVKLFFRKVGLIGPTFLG